MPLWGNLSFRIRYAEPKFIDSLIALCVPRLDVGDKPRKAATFVGELQ